MNTYINTNPSIKTLPKRTNKLISNNEPNINQAIDQSSDPER